MNSLKRSSGEALKWMRRAQKSAASMLQRFNALTWLAGAVLLFAIISCSTINRTVVQLPNYPGATYIGSEQCDTCHDNIYKDFATADHARLMARGTNALDAGCESCHGPCSTHAESGGDTKPPYTFTGGRAETSSYGAHLAVAPARSEETVCYTCHADVRGQFNLPNHHPVPEGRMTCSDCHDPHKGSIFKGGGTSILSENEMCLRCHPAQQGPFVFEHEAVREGCTTCHNPHGSVNPKLLVNRNSNLCLKCHFVQQTSGGQLLIGGSDHTLRLQQGTCWTAGCHEAVHGSRVNPQLQF
ncbi:MAG TPA: cytochrome c3 family protein [Verrucomicrobiae bacterium]|nr:cytochrome c3 family protein [Verrucomicrobiae bacterium]